MNGYHYEYDLEKANYLVRKGFKVISLGYGKKDGKGFACFKHCGQLSLELDNYKIITSK